MSYNTSSIHMMYLLVWCVHRTQYSLSHTRQHRMILWITCVLYFSYNWYGGKCAKYIFAWPFNYSQAFIVIHCANIRLFCTRIAFNMAVQIWQESEEVRAKQIPSVYLPSWIDSVICFIFSHIFSWNHKTNKQLKTDSRFLLSAGTNQQVEVIALWIHFPIRAKSSFCNFWKFICFGNLINDAPNRNDNKYGQHCSVHKIFIEMQIDLKASTVCGRGIAKPCANQK